MTIGEDPDREKLREQIAALRAEHAALDSALQAMIRESPCDLMETRRLKKRKLLLKDRAQALEDLLFPDIIA